MRLAIGPRLMPPQVPGVSGCVIVMAACPLLVASTVEVAVMVALSDSVDAGVKVTAVPDATLDESLRPPTPAGLTVRSTVLVKAPVPITVGVQEEVCAVVMVVGVQASVTPVMVGGTAVTAIVAEPETLVNPACTECAMQRTLPLSVGVKIPFEVMLPPVAVQVTALLKAPVPETAAAQVEVCAVVMAEGVAVTTTPVTVGGKSVTAIVAEPETLVNPACAECAMQRTLPLPAGVKTPVEVMLPPVAVQVTALL